MNSNAVILAAGTQKRFGGKKPKCLYRIDGTTVLERLVSKLNMPTILVLHDGWRSEDKEEVAALGLAMAYVRSRAHIGVSIAVGLRASRSDHLTTVIVAADTYIPPDESLLIPCLAAALFDPWQWITIYHVLATRSNADHFEAKCFDRVEYLGLGTMDVDIVKTDYVNVNDPLGLISAKLRERAAARPTVRLE